MPSLLFDSSAKWTKTFYCDDVIFNINGNEILKLCSDGTIMVNGKVVAKDEEVINELRKHMKLVIPPRH